MARQKQFESIFQQLFSKLPKSFRRLEDQPDSDQGNLKILYR